MLKNFRGFGEEKFGNNCPLPDNKQATSPVRTAGKQSMKVKRLNIPYSG